MFWSAIQSLLLHTVVVVSQPTAPVNEILAIKDLAELVLRDFGAIGMSVIVTVSSVLQGQKMHTSHDGNK